jgi:hypothetical protein
VNQPKRGIVFQERIPTMFKQQTSGDLGWREISTAVPLAGIFEGEKLGDLTPVANTVDHVLADPEQDHSVISQEKIGFLRHHSYTFFKPSIAEDEGLMARKPKIDG